MSEELVSQVIALCEGNPGSAMVAGQLFAEFGRHPLELVLREDLRGSDLYILHRKILVPAWEGNVLGAILGTYGVLEVAGEARRMLDEYVGG
ncbi:MAG: hypothetical protein ACXABY_08810 [Candidatus Thorarchaeota archaeon]